MKILLKSYNLADASDYLIKHLFKNSKTITVKEAANQLGVTPKYLLKKMEELKILPKNGIVSSVQERFFRRLDKAPWNTVIYFKKSTLDTVWKNIEAWKKARGYGRNFKYTLYQPSLRSPVQVCLQRPKKHVD